MSKRRFLCIAGVLGSVLAAPALAHDSWLRRPDGTQGDLLVLELEGGARYPKSEWPTPAARLAAAACVGPNGSFPLVPRGERDTSLELRARADSEASLSCWVELKPQDIAIAPELVPTYFQDIRAPAPVRDTWSRLHAQGTSWKEVYRKFIRTELPGLPAKAQDLSGLRRPLNAALELLPVGGKPLRAGVDAEFVALSNGRPVPGLEVEFVSRRSPLGIWRRTDDHGRFRFTAPFGGEWLLRSTVLDTPEPPQNVWHSRFATLLVRFE